MSLEFIQSIQSIHRFARFCRVPKFIHLFLLCDNVQCHCCCKCAVSFENVVVSKLVLTIYTSYSPKTHTLKSTGSVYCSMFPYMNLIQINPICPTDTQQYLTLTTRSWWSLYERNVCHKALTWYCLWNVNGRCFQMPVFDKVHCLLLLKKCWVFLLGLTNTCTNVYGDLVSIICNHSAAWENS